MHILNLSEWTPLCYGFICTLYFYNKMLLNSYEEDLKQFNFHQRAKTIFAEFCRHSIKLKTCKIWPSTFKFQSLPILVNCSNRRQEKIK